MLSRQDRLRIAPEREPGRQGDVMPDLPGRPDLAQLRRQARELLRAAAKGEPTAAGRLRAVSERVTLSAAQLAVAREYGYRSWPALKAEAEHRRRLSEAAMSIPLPGADERGSHHAPGRWSFREAAAIKTSVGVLSPEALVVGADHAMLHASLMPSENRQLAAARPSRLPVPLTLFTRRTRRKLSQQARRRNADAAVTTLRDLAQSDDIAVADDRGVRYALRPAGMSAKVGTPERPAEPMSVRLWLDPVPGRQVAWIEIHGSDSSRHFRAMPDGTASGG
jgi:hypothetical protein